MALASPVPFVIRAAVSASVAESSAQRRGEPPCFSNRTSDVNRTRLRPCAGRKSCQLYCGGTAWSDCGSERAEGIVSAVCDPSGAQSALECSRGAACTCSERAVRASKLDGGGRCPSSPWTCMGTHGVWFGYGSRREAYIFLTSSRARRWRRFCITALAM